MNARYMLERTVAIELKEVSRNMAWAWILKESACKSAEFKADSEKGVTH